MGWIGVDLDGTLAHYTRWDGGAIGEPVPAMVERVKQWLAEGQEVRILTARVANLYNPRASEKAQDEAAEQRTRIRDWTQEHIGQRLYVTAVKDFGMIRLYDDRCVQVEPNTGRLTEPTPNADELREVLIFARSVIKSREGWTTNCEAVIGAAIEQLRASNAGKDKADDTKPDA